VGPRAGRRLGASADASVFEARVWDQLFGAPRLSADEAAALAMVARPRVVPPGEMVFTHDEAAHAVVFVRDGDVTLGHRAADGRLHVVRQVRGPAWLDQGSAWLGGVHGIDAWATTPSLVVEWPCDALQTLLRVHPGLCPRLLGSLSRELRQMVAQAHGLMHLDAPARFAQWLIEQVQTNGSGAGVVRLAQRKRDIASQLAITPETLSRVMRLLSAKGLISVSGYNVQVHDLPALQQLAAAEG
jgi:CRP-like cAMP-binding protein